MMKIFNIVFAVAVLAINGKARYEVYGSSISLTSPTHSYVKAQNKHPLEARKSWELHLELERSLANNNSMRKKGETTERKLSNSSLLDDLMAEDDTPYEIKHKKPKKHIPFAGGDTVHGMMIDAGSQGSRLHIYEWKKRFLLDEDDLLDVAHGLKLSFPTSTSRWTDKYTPGYVKLYCCTIDDYAMC